MSVCDSIAKSMPAVEEGGNMLFYVAFAVCVFGTASALYSPMDTTVDLLRAVMGGADPVSLTNRVMDIISGSMYLQPGWFTPDQKVDIDPKYIAKNLTANQQIMAVKKMPLDPNTTYYFTCKTRLLENPPDAMWATINTHAVLEIQGGSQRMLHFGKMNHVMKEDDWVEVGGDFITPMDVKTVGILVSIQSENIPLEVSPSTVLLTKLLPNPAWKKEADERIEVLRKGTITINLTNSKKYAHRDLKFKLEQIRSSFPVGSAIGGGAIAGNSALDKKYQKFFFENFNWGTPENDVKWRVMERTEGRPNFKNGDKALDALEKVNCGSRGHCLLWARTRTIPSWLVDKSPEDIKENILRRFSYTAEHFGGRFTHWDVNNEQLHEAWYAEKLKEPRIMSWMFKEFHALVPSTKLFTNDFMVFTNGLMTQSYKQQVRKLLEDSAPVHGVGIQSHFANKARIEVLTKRLAVLSELGLPIWMTEFDVMLDEEEEIVEQMEDALRLCFSHPNIEGIIFWGFWDQKMWRKQSALASGANFELTAAGRLFKRLFFEEWRTNETFSMPEDEEETLTWRTNAFYGNYRLTAYKGNETLWTEEFELEKKHEATVDLDI